MNTEQGKQKENRRARSGEESGGGKKNPPPSLSPTPQAFSQLFFFAEPENECTIILEPGTG